MNTFQYPPLPVDLLPHLTLYQIGLIIWVTLALTVILPLIYFIIKTALEKPCYIGVHDWWYSENKNGIWEEVYVEGRHKYRQCQRCQKHQTHGSVHQYED